MGIQKPWNEEIQNMHCSSRNESFNLKDKSYWKPSNGQIKFIVRENIYVATWRWEFVFISHATQEVAKNLKNWNCAAFKKGNTENQPRLEFLLLHDQGSRTVNLLRGQVRRLPELLVSVEDSKLLWSRLIEQLWQYRRPHQALISSSSRKSSREVGMLRNTREHMNTHGNVFDWQHAPWDPDELHNDSRNLATSLATLRTEEIEKSGSEETLQSITCLMLFMRSKTKSRRWKVSFVFDLPCRGYWDLYSQWHPQFRVISHRRCICTNSVTKRNFRAGSWIPRISMRRKFVTEGKVQNSFTDRKTGKCFQRKTIGSCSRRDTCSVLHTHATGSRESMWKEVEIRKEDLNWSKHPLQYRKWKTQTDGKSLNSPQANLATTAENSVHDAQDEKHRRVTIGIIPCVVVTNLEADAFMVIVAFVGMLNGELLLRREVEKRRYSRISCNSEKKNPRLCIWKQRSDEFCPTESWRILD